MRTPDGIRVAVFYTKLQTGSYAPSWTPTNPRPDRNPPDQHPQHAVTDYAHAARLTTRGLKLVTPHAPTTRKD
jgi:hypothetical protein